MPSPRTPPLEAHDGVAAAAVERLRPILAAQRTLADVLAWTRAATPPHELVDIVTQDEYTHDVVVAVRGTVSDLYLAYDTT